MTPLQIAFWAAAGWAVFDALKGRHVRQNLDAYTDDKGVIHPIRGTEGYDPAKAKGDKPPAAKPLVQIEGTPKQVAWAQDIRRTMLQEVDEKLDKLARVAQNKPAGPKRTYAKGALAYAKQVREELANQKDARWWIDNRQADSWKLMQLFSRQRERKGERKYRIGYSTTLEPPPPTYRWGEEP